MSLLRRRTRSLFLLIRLAYRGVRRLGATSLRLPGHSPFIAEADGQVVGVLDVGPASDESGAGQIYVIYVHPTWWGTEAGQLLLECAASGAIA